MCAAHKNQTEKTKQKTKCETGIRRKNKKNLKTIFKSFARSELCLTHFDKMWTKTGELCVEVNKNYNAQAARRRGRGNERRGREGGEGDSMRLWQSSGRTKVYLALCLHTQSKKARAALKGLCGGEVGVVMGGAGQGVAWQSLHKIQRRIMRRKRCGPCAR